MSFDLGEPPARAAPQMLDAYVPIRVGGGGEGTGRVNKAAYAEAGSANASNRFLLQSLDGDGGGDDDDDFEFEDDFLDDYLARRTPRRQVVRPRRWRLWLAVAATMAVVSLFVSAVVVSLRSHGSDDEQQQQHQSSSSSSSSSSSAGGRPPPPVGSHDQSSFGEPFSAAPYEFEVSMLVSHEDGGLLKGPDGLALMADGRVLVANEKGHNVVVVDVEQRTVTELIGEGLEFPEEVVVDGEGNIYVSDDFQHAVFRWSKADGSLSRVLGESDGLLSPEGLALGGGDKWLYVSDEKTHGVYRWSEHDGLEQLAGEQDGVATPEGMVLHGGQLYLTDDSVGGVLRLDPVTKNTTVWLDGDVSVLPEGIAFDRFGDAWITDNAGEVHHHDDPDEVVPRVKATLQRFSPAGRLVQKIELPFEAGSVGGVVVTDELKVIVAAEYYIKEREERHSELWAIQVTPPHAGAPR